MLSAENYMQTRADELKNWGKYGAAIPQPANLRNHLGLLESQSRQWSSNDADR